MLENDQDMTRLAGVVARTLDAHPDAHAFLLRRHGLYTWGDTLADAERHVEILEFLFEDDRPHRHVAGRGPVDPVGRSIMAILRIPEEDRTLHDEAAIGQYLADRGIDFERTAVGADIAAGASAEQVLAAYADTIAGLKARGGYVTADVIDVKSDTPGLDAMLARFNSEHWHDEDEVRFIVEGRGLFHIHPRRQGPSSRSRSSPAI